MLKSTPQILLFALFLPIFFRVIPGVRELPLNPVIYSLAVLVVATLGHIILSRKLQFIRRSLRLPVLFVLLSAVPFLVRAYYEGYLREGVGFTSGLLLGLLGLLLLNQVDPFHEGKDKFIGRFAVGLSILFLLQLGVSLYESTIGIPALEDIYASQQSLFKAKDISTVFGLDLGEQLGIRLSLSGLLGQYNYFGSMLVFINFIFITQYFRTREGYWLVFLCIVCIAAMLNTTRIAMLAIAITDLIALSSNRKWYWLTVGTGTLLGAVILFFTSDLFLAFLDFVQRTETMTFRFDLWRFLMDKISESSIASLVWGMPPSALFSSFGSEFMGRRLGSFENQYFTNLLYFGLPSLVLYIYTFHIRLSKDSTSVPLHSVNFGRLLSINVLITSLTLDCALNFASFFLIIVGYYSCVVPFSRHVA